MEYAVTFRMPQKYLPVAIRTAQPRKNEKGVLALDGKGTQTDLSALPASLLEAGLRLSHVARHNREDDKGGYMLLTFIFSDQASMHDPELENFFGSLCNNFWEIGVFYNPSITSVSCWGRVPTHNPDGSPIMIWHRTAEGEKDLEKGKHEMVPTHALSLIDGEFALIRQ